MEAELEKMGSTVTHIRSILTFGLAIAYLSNLFFQSVWLTDFILILMVLVIFMSLIAVTGSAKMIGYISFGVSILLLLYHQAPIHIWEQALEENLYLVVMFSLVPLLRVPIQYGGYFEALQGFFRRFVNTKSRFYLLVSFISAFVGVLVNMAVVPLVYAISKASDLSSNKKLLSAALSRGFTTCTIWAPTMASMGLITQLTGAKWHLFFPFGILGGVICGLTGYTLTILEERRSGDESEVVPKIAVGKINYGKVIELSVFGVVLITGIAVISFFSGIPTIIVVSLAALIFPVIWLTIIGRLSVLYREFRGEYFHKSLPNLKNEIVLFVGAGLFATSITYSHLGDYVPKILSLLVGDSVVLFSSVIILFSLALAALGVHPIVSIAIIGGTVNASVYGVTPTYMAMLLASCWAMGISVSPSAATIIAISGLTEESPIEIGTRWNGIYALVSSFALIFMMTILRWLQIL